MGRQPKPKRSTNAGLKHIKTIRCPLKLPEAAHAHFMRLAKMLKAERVIAQRDLDILSSAALSLMMIEIASGELDQHGITLQTEKGATVPNPAYAILAKAQGAYLQAMVQLGLSPKTRNDVSRLEDDTTEDDIVL